MRYLPRPELLKVSDVAGILKLSTLTVYKYIKEHKIEAIEIGGHYRISPESLTKFIRKHTIPAEDKKYE